MYREEQFRNSDIGICNRKENKEVFDPRNRSFLKEQQHSYAVNNSVHDYISKYKQPNNSNGSFKHSDTIIPNNIKLNNNNHNDTKPTRCTTRKEVLPLQDKETLPCDKHDSDTDILVENFAEVASNRALSNITDCMIAELLEAITVTGIESSNVDRWSEAERNYCRKPNAIDLDNALLHINES